MKIIGSHQFGGAIISEGAVGIPGMFIAQAQGEGGGTVVRSDGQIVRKQRNGVAPVYKLSGVSQIKTGRSRAVNTASIVWPPRRVFPQSAKVQTRAGTGPMSGR